MKKIHFCPLIALAVLGGVTAAVGNFTLCDIDASVCNDCAVPCTNCERVSCIYENIMELDLSDLNITQLPKSFSEMSFLSQL